MLASRFIVVLAGFVLVSEASLMGFHVPPNFGCENGLKHGLFRHRDVAACKGTWEGHVRDAGLCSRGWHVCSVNDSEVLRTISHYEASHVEGCYAINAAHNGGVCQECQEDMDEMAGVGADCPRVDEKSNSCIGKGKIDASCCSKLLGQAPCNYSPWLSGVVCCKDKDIEAAPLITLSPVSSIRVPVGTKVILKCKASGDPLPTITWYKNGYPVSVEGLSNDVRVEDGEVVSTLALSGAGEAFDGLYLCRAENRRGFAVSYTSDVTTYPLVSDTVACKNKEDQQLLHGGLIAACKGGWKGHVKRASKKLCAKGWKVCGLKNRGVLNRLPWEEITSLAGCYAYNAATSDHFACTKCSHRQKGNRMSGIGGDCGSIDDSGVSCLSSGRIDVWADEDSEDEFDIDKTLTRNTCAYKSGLTTGVMCCKSGKAKNRKRKGKRCSSKCQENSHCTRKGVCKCNSGYKRAGGVCVSRKRGRCSHIVCQNGGKCKKGKCFCPPRYSGHHCEIEDLSDAVLLQGGGVETIV